MSSTPVTIRPNGSMTLPKKLRDEFQTVHFLAMKIDGGVMLKPIREEIEYYEKKDGTVGLHFPYGIDAGKLADMFEEAIEKIEKEDGMKKRKKSSRKRKHG